MAKDIEKVSSGNPKKIARRAKNKFTGRKIIRKVEATFLKLTKGRKEMK